jgi:hypothetical protein
LTPGASARTSPSPTRPPSPFPAAIGLVSTVRPPTIDRLTQAG